MRARGRLAMAVVLVAFLGVPAGAGEEAPQGAKEAKIRQLLKVTGAAKMGAQVMDQMLSSFETALPQVPATFWSEFRKEIKPEDLDNLIVPIYARHFDLADIEGLLQFYASPVGEKLNREMPGILQESLSVGQAWGRELAERANQRLKEKGYKTDG